jgi:CHAD domain-containing protein
LQEPGNDVEPVHQLRVGVRRAVAVLDVFADYVKRKTRKRARKKLRRLRRAAGRARDWDVFLETLAHRPGRPPGSDFLVGYALGQRLAAQADLEAVRGEFPSGFETFIRETLAGVGAAAADGRPAVLVDLARPVLGGLLRELHEVVEVHGGPEQLHRVRIVAKRLRYAMELFAHCLAAPFQESLYPAVEALQEILGAANDSRVAKRHLDALRMLRSSRPADWKRYRAAVDGLSRFHQRRLLREVQRFRKWWQDWQDAKSDELFAAMLRRPQRVNS